MVDVFIVFAMHCVADFPMQGSYLAKMKSKSLYMLLCHCAIYTLFMAIGFGAIAAKHEMLHELDWNFVIMLLFYSHFIIDYIKEYFTSKLSINQEDDDKDREIWKAKILFYCDQVIHLVIAYAILTSCIK